MKRMFLLVLGFTTTVCVIAPAGLVAGRAADNASPIYGVTIPAGYRQWELVAPSHEAELNELRVILGNRTAIKAYVNGNRFFPYGTILAISQAFVPGHSTTVQFMVKDSKRYPTTGGWGFGRFVDGKPIDAAQHKTCFSWYATHAKNQDFVFTRYAP